MPHCVGYILCVIIWNMYSYAYLIYTKYAIMLVIYIQGF